MRSFPHKIEGALVFLGIAVAFFGTTAFYPADVVGGVPCTDDGTHMVYCSGECDLQYSKCLQVGIPDIIYCLDDTGDQSCRQTGNPNCQDVKKGAFTAPCGTEG
jgi:hypothetical protein